MSKKKKQNSAHLNAYKKIGWMLLFVTIAALTVYAVTAQNSAFSMEGFREYVRGAKPVYIALAALAMFGFIVFEGLAVLVVCRALGYRRGIKNGFIYSASDIYFSAITPSATGGQPVCAWFMMKDGIPGAVSTVALIANLVLYTLSILVIGLIAFLTSLEDFLRFSLLSKALILFGCVALTLLAALFVLCLFRPKIVYGIARGLLTLLAKLRLVRKLDVRLEKLRAAMEQYEACAELILKNKRAMLLAFLMNFLQRTSQITVAMLAYIAVGGSFAQALRVWAMQAYAVIGSNCVPVPGAMGVSDYLLLDGFGSMMVQESAIHLELLTRALSFYSMIVFCGVAILIKYILMRRHNKRNKEETT